MKLSCLYVSVNFGVTGGILSKFMEVFQGMIFLSLFFYMKDYSHCELLLLQAVKEKICFVSLCACVYARVHVCEGGGVGRESVLVRAISASAPTW